MTKVVHSREYSANFIAVGCSVNEDGEPLVEMNGAVVGTVDYLLSLISAFSQCDNQPDLAALTSRVDELGASFGNRVMKVIRFAEVRNVRLS